MKFLQRIAASQAEGGSSVKAPPPWWITCRRRPPNVRQKIVLQFGADAVTLEQLHAGLIAFGGTGSGKTSSLIRLASALLHAGCGFVVCCAKTDEAARWMKLCARAGRSSDVIRFAPGAGCSFDLLGYELNRPGGSPESLSTILGKLGDLAARERGEMGGSERFFVLGGQRTSLETIRTVRAGTGAASIPDLCRCLASAPKTPDEAASPEWAEKSFCGRLLRAAAQQARSEVEVRRVERLVDWWLVEWAGLADRTRSCFEAECSNVWAQLCQEPFDQLFGTGGTPITPEDVTSRGKIWLLDSPVLNYGATARLAQFAAILPVQEACLRRNPGEGPPVVVWRDEAGMFVHSGHDAMVQTVARSHGLITVDICQDMATLLTALGGEKARHECDMFVANHMTKLFFNNAEPGTNEYASRLLGQERKLLFSGSSQPDPNPGFLDRFLGTGSVPTISWQQNYLPLVRPEDFTQLRKGGMQNRRLVDAYLAQGGRVFSTGKPFAKVMFQQEEFDG